MPVAERIKVDNLKTSSPDLSDVVFGRILQGDHGRSAPGVDAHVASSVLTKLPCGDVRDAAVTPNVGVSIA